MNTALILSGGVGSRLGGDMPKQYIEVGGRILLSYCLERLSRHPLVDAVQIVAQEEWQGTIRSCLKRYDINKKFRGFSNPGENRQLSIYNGLRDILTYAAGTDDTVLVHDGARPCLPGALITECVNALERHDGVIPVLPMKDTVYVSSDGKHVSSLLNRGGGFLPDRRRSCLYWGNTMRPMSGFSPTGFSRSTVQRRRRSLVGWTL